jgi:Fic family protein
MKREHFAGSPSGSLVPTERGQWAFVPHPLPPILDLGPLAEVIEEAGRAIGELNGIGRTLHNPMLLITPLQTQEALSSSSMEGTYTTIDALMIVEAGGPETDPTLDTREVANYRRALTSAVASLTNLPLSIRTLCDAHRTLLRNVARHRGATIEAGTLKSLQNFIGARSIEEARFIPPPPREAAEALGLLEKHIHRDDRGGIPDLVDAALIHYQFETIHPFADGNGRVGRMLIPLFLMSRGVMNQPLLYLSPALEDHKDAYIDLMYAVSRDGSWTNWIRFFLEAVIRACRNAIRTADALFHLQRRYRAQLQEAGRSANLFSIADMLFETPVVSIPRVAEQVGVTYRAASLNVMSLVDTGILHEVTGTSNPKLFAAREILQTITETIDRDARTSA